MHCIYIYIYTLLAYRVYKQTCPSIVLSHYSSYLCFICQQNVCLVCLCQHENPQEPARYSRPALQRTECVELSHKYQYHLKYSLKIHEEKTKEMSA